jgi:uncharacterized C2H2 Zn-finger protein
MMHDDLAGDEIVMGAAGVVDHEEEIIDEQDQVRARPDDEDEDGLDGHPDDEAPLALVVDKSKLNKDYHDSGHEDDFVSGGSSPVQHEAHRYNETRHNSGHKARDDEVEEAEDLSMSKNNGSSIKIKDFARQMNHDENRAEGLDNQSDAMSEISSADTWGTDVSRRQVMTMNGELVYPCDFCDKIFVNRSHLHSHLVTHTGEKSFACPTCGKSFGRKSTLRAHMTTHTKTSNFMCPLCDKACNDNNSLEEHMR